MRTPVFVSRITCFADYLGLDDLFPLTSFKESDDCSI